MAVHPFSGLAAGWSEIPDWEKGSKVSLSSDEGSHWRDSSDTDDAGAGIDTSSDFEDAPAEDKGSAAETVHATPGGVARQVGLTMSAREKGKAREIENGCTQAARQAESAHPYDKALQDLDAPTPTQRTARYKPRRYSTSSSSSPGPSSSPSLVNVCHRAATLQGAASLKLSTWTYQQALNETPSTSRPLAAPASTSQNAPTTTRAFSSRPLRPPSGSNKDSGHPAGSAVLGRAASIAPTFTDTRQTQDLVVRTFSHRRVNSRNTASNSGGLGRTSSAPMGLFSSPPSAGLGTGDDRDSPFSILRSGSTVDSVIDEAFAIGSGTIELSNMGLMSLPDKIKSLEGWVTYNQELGELHPLDIKLHLSNNLLSSRSLPASFFSLRNLTHLFLRGNELEELPAAIGDLCNLKDLNIGMNKLKWLPAEIDRLRLENFVATPNPYEVYKPLEAELGTVSSTAAATTVVTKDGAASHQSRITAPREIGFRVPSLLESVTRKLLAYRGAPVVSSTAATSPSSRLDSGHPRTRNFQSVKDEAISPRTDTAPLAEQLLVPFLPLIQPLPQHLRGLLKRIDHASALHDHHPEMVQTCSVCREPYYAVAEQRLEWRWQLAGQKVGYEHDASQWVPIRWRGCSSDCLNFLDS